MSPEPRPWSRLEACFADPTVDEVLVNGRDAVYVERDGTLERFSDGWPEGEVERVVQLAIAPLGLSFDRAHPVVDARLGDGSRVHAVGAPVALDGPYLCVRRFQARALDPESFGIDAQQAALLQFAVSSGYSILISGGTSTGKTTLLNLLARWIPPAARVVTIEENAELQLQSPHVVRMEARPGNTDGAGEVSVRALVRAALRMRPDRLVVGEVRGLEAYDLLQALNTGHAGCMATVHANNPEGAIDRLVDLAAQAQVGTPLVRQRVADAFDLIIQLTRIEGHRRIAGIRRKECL